MNAGRLLALYEQVAEAPDAVPRLRRFLLDLSVRGRLVAQDADEGQGSVLLNQIADAWKARLASGEIKKIKRWPEVSAEAVPFEIPSNWALVRLGEAMDLINGRAFKPSDWTQDGLPIVRIQNLNKVSAAFNRFDGEVKPKFLIDTGDFLISWSGTPGTSFGAHIWDRGPAVLNQHIFKAVLLGEAFEKAFLKIAINSRLLELIEQAHGGVGLQHITKPKLEAVTLTLPPRAEQRRIVAKVEELMALLDRLEAARAAREATRDRLTAASLARLTTGEPTTATQDTQQSQAHLDHGHLKRRTVPAWAFGESKEYPFQTHARFALDALPALTTRPHQIKPLRQTILNIAVRGKLVDQDPTDEPASELLQRVTPEVEKKTTGRRRRAKPLPVVDLADAPFELPNGWAWARFPEIGTFGRGKSKHRPRNDPALYSDGTHLMIQTGDVARSGGRITTYTNKYNDVGLAQSMLWPEGTLCITIAANIADSGILDFDACFPDSVVGFVPASVFENARYFEYFVRTAKANLLEFAPSTAQKNINLDILTSVLIPLPPLAEQHRIVAKVDALMALCDRLEAALTTADTTRACLLEALLHEALEPAAQAVTEAAE